MMTPRRAGRQRFSQGDFVYSYRLISYIGISHIGILQAAA